MGGCGDVEPRGDRVLGADALVAPVEGIAGDDRHADLVAAGRGGTIEAPPVQDEADVGDVGSLVERREDFLRIGHLGYALRVNEARYLETPHTGGDQAVDQFDFRCRREYAGLALQSIARSHLDDLDFAGHAHDSSRHDDGGCGHN